MYDEIIVVNKPIRYIIPGDPTPLARPRFGRGRVWDAQKQLKMYWRVNLERLHDDRPLITGPIHVSVNFFMPIQKAARKAWNPAANNYHIFRPDCDNLIKFILDVANGIIYKDDCKISSIWSKKRYDTTPRTEFTVAEIKQ